MSILHDRRFRAGLGAIMGAFVFVLAAPAIIELKHHSWLSEAKAQSHSGGKKAGSGGHGGSHAGKPSGGHSDSHDDGHSEDEHADSDHGGGKSEGGKKGASKGQGTGLVASPGRGGRKIEDKVFRAPGHDKSHDDDAHENDDDTHERDDAASHN